MSEPTDYELDRLGSRAAVPRWLARRRGEYETTFGSDIGQSVLADLWRFCLPERSVFDPNPFVMARNEGRREVWLHIISCVKWDDEKLSDIIKQAERAKREETI